MPVLKTQTQCQGYRGDTDRHNARATDTVPGLQRHIARAKDTMPGLQTQTQFRDYRHNTMPGLQTHRARATDTVPVL